MSISKRRLLQLAVCAGLLGGAGVSACNQPNPTILKTNPETPDGSRLQIARGQSCDVVLPSLGATSAYNWVLQDDYDKNLVSFVEEKAAPSEYPRNPPPNYAPARIFVFEALAVGSLRLRFRQEPLADAPPLNQERSFEVQIIASQPSPLPTGEL